MPSSDRTALAVAVAVVLALGATARAQQMPTAQGFSVERFYPSAPGGGWLVMDDLDFRGTLGGAFALTLGYAGNPLRVSDGVNHVAVVSSEAFANLGAALSYRRWRFYLGFDAPLVITGTSGSVGNDSFVSPSVDLGANPDSLSDARIGTDVRIVGKPGGRFRFGASAQLWIPFGSRSDYDTDGTFRGMIRALLAGDVGLFTWAAQLGAHIRPLDEPAPGSPRGSELLFGVAGGIKLPVGTRGKLVVVVGPELFGATAFRALFGADTTAFEALLAARLHQIRNDRIQVRVKLGVGAGLEPHFGAPDWRVVLGAEVLAHAPTD